MQDIECQFFMLLLTTLNFRDVNNERDCESEMGYCIYFSRIFTGKVQFLLLDVLIKNSAVVTVLNS